METTSIDNAGENDIYPATVPNSVMIGGSFDSAGIAFQVGAGVESAIDRFRHPMWKTFAAIERFTSPAMGLGTMRHVSKAHEAISIASSFVSRAADLSATLVSDPMKDIYKVSTVVSSLRSTAYQLGQAVASPSYLGHNATVSSRTHTPGISIPATGIDVFGILSKPRDSFYEALVGGHTTMSTINGASQSAWTPGMGVTSLIEMMKATSFVTTQPFTSGLAGELSRPYSPEYVVKGTSVNFLSDQLSPYGAPLFKASPAGDVTSLIANGMNAFVTSTKSMYEAMIGGGPMLSISKSVCELINPSWRNGHARIVESFVKSNLGGTNALNRTMADVLETLKPGHYLLSNSSSLMDAHRTAFTITDLSKMGALAYSATLPSALALGFGEVESEYGRINLRPESVTVPGPRRSFDERLAALKIEAQAMSVEYSEESVSTTMEKDGVQYHSKVVNIYIIVGKDNVVGNGNHVTKYIFNA